MATTDTHDLARDLADGIGDVVPSKDYARIRAGEGTLCYSNPRKDGVLLDFAASAVEGAPAKLRRPLNVKGPRARLTVSATGKNVAAARGLLGYVAQKAGQS